MKTDSGKSIPLIPGTTTPHKCPETEIIHDFDKTKESPPERNPQENLQKILDKEKSSTEEAPPYREFDEEKTKTEVKRISVWARIQADSINFPDSFDKNSASHDELKARQIDRNVDKKDLMRFYFYVKYGKKNDSVDNLP